MKKLNNNSDKTQRETGCVKQPICVRSAMQKLSEEHQNLVCTLAKEYLREGGYKQEELQKLISVCAKALKKIIETNHRDGNNKISEEFAKLHIIEAMDKYYMKDYNWSERLDHIAYMFNVRTNRKKYENFIVNAIYTKVNNQELMPVTQQCIKNEGKYYFIDLYFPQINFGVEIDEGHHLNEENKKKDQVREEDIKTAIECEVMRISIFDERKKKKTYHEICKDIDKTVDRINFLISEKGSIKWISNDEEKNKVIENKQFSITDNAYYNSITEIYNICGGKLDGSGDAESLGGCYYRRNEKYHLWVPTLTIEHNGNTAAAKTKYMNFLSEDKETITEISQNGFKEDEYLEKNLRAVFLRVKDVFGRKCIKFIGIFEFKNYEEGNNNKRFFKRIAETVEISDLKPTSNT